VIASSACAINCRYCFRRHFPYQSFQPDRQIWGKVRDYVAARPDVSEVILSGGDPLTLNDRHLSWIAKELADLPHVTTLRLHSRVPVVIPQRVCDDLLQWMTSTRLKLVLVIHSNHANELSIEVGEALQQFRQAGVVLLNQSVLLRNINDSADALSALSERLFEFGVLPYYLHMLDPVTGASHFDVHEHEAKAIMATLTSQLPGYLIPRLVRETPGLGAKESISLVNDTP
jgi:EF-P beta-lysylation protein EpmB